MNVRDVESGFMIKLSRGEKVVESLTSFCETRGITGGVFSAVGAVKNATIGYYSLARREYFFKTFPDDMEVASMTGNIALVDPEGQHAAYGAGGKPKVFIHAHAVLSRMDGSLSCVGAHIKEAQVAVTLEIYLTPFATPLHRAFDEETGLKLLELTSHE